MPVPLIALAVPTIAAAARVAAPTVGKAVAQGAAKNAGKAVTKPPATKPQPPKQNNPSRPKDDKKPEPKKEEGKPEPKKDEHKPGQPNKEEQKPGQPKKEEQKPVQPKKEEQKPAQPKKEEQKPGQPKQEENKPGHPKKEEHKPGQPKKEENKPRQPKKEDQKPGQPKKEENKPGQPKKDEQKPGQPKKEDDKPKKPTCDREGRDELTEQVLDTTSQVIDRITNRPGRDDDAPSDGVKPTGPKPNNPVVTPKPPKAGDLLVSLAVKNNGQDWFWFIHHPTEANTGMTMHAEGTISKGFTVKLTRKTTVDKLKSAAGTKSVELIKLQWVEKRWWGEDMFGANKAAKAEAPFETTAFGVKPPTVTECAPVKESASEMAMDRMAARIKCKDDKTWIIESCEALVRAGALKQNVLTFLEKLKGSCGALGGKTPTGPNVSPANPGKQLGRTCGTGTPTKGKDDAPAGTPTKTGKPGAPNKIEPGKPPATIVGLSGPGSIIAAQSVAKVAANAAAANK